MAVDWAEVYRTSYTELVQYLYRRVGDADRAQDLAQEAFARALKHDPAEPRAWLFRVATNLLTDERRSAERRRRHLRVLRDEEPVAAPAPEVEEELERERRRARVREALAGLSERDREVLLLWDAGLSYAEIASSTGLSPGAIGTTLARARRRLADALQSMEGTHVACC